MHTTYIKKTDPHYEFNINTGYIYTDLCNMWSEVPRELIEKVEWKLKSILWYKKIITVPFVDEKKEYLDGKRTLLNSVQEYSKDPNNPPYTEYFVHPNGAIGFDLIAYNENCLLENDTDADFDFFFALKLIVLDLMKLEDFLVYQFETNFNRDNKKYKSFLQALILKYRTYFQSQPIAEMIQGFIANELNLQQNQLKHNKPQVEKINAPEAVLLKNEAPSIPEKQETKKFPNIFAETVNPDHLTVKQASEFLNIAEQTIYGYTHRKQIPFYKPHKKLYFLKSELEAWLRQGKQGNKDRTPVRITTRKGR